MPFPLAAIGLGLAGAGAIGSAISAFNTPEFPLDEADIDRMVNLQLNRTLAQEASGARRRLAGAGIGGSAAVNAIIQDQSSRTRALFEEQKARLKQQLAGQQFNRDVMAQQNRGNFFGNLASIGFSGFQLGTNPFAQQSQNLQQLQPQGGGGGLFQGGGFSPNAVGLNLDPTIGGFG